MTLADLVRLEESVVLVQMNDRRPRHLYPKLGDRGYASETVDTEHGLITAILAD